MTLSDSVRQHVRQAVRSVRRAPIVSAVTVGSLALAIGANALMFAVINGVVLQHRGDLLAQVMAETTLLTMLGGFLGLGLATVGLSLFPYMVPSAFIPADAELRVDGRLVLFVLALSAVVAAVVGGLPALQLSRGDVRDALQVEGSRSTSDPTRPRLRRSLVAVEAMLTITITVAAASLGLAVWRLLRVDPGFATENLLTMRLTLPAQRYQGDAGRIFFETLLERVTATPDTVSATVALQYPPHVFSTSQFQTESQSNPGDTSPTAFHTIAGSRFLETFGIRLRAGRWLDDSASPSAPMEVVLNDVAAQRFFGGRDPVGDRMRIIASGSDTRSAEIVGVVAAVRNRGAVVEPQPEIFTSLRQAPERRRSQLFLVVRSRGGNDAVATIRRIVASIDPEQPVYGVSSVQAGFTNGLLPRRIAARLLIVFAVLAVGMAALGVYGTLSHTVSERTQEIGLRRSLGASFRDVAVFVLRQSMVPAVIGVVLGCALSFVLAMFVSSQFFGVKPTLVVVAVAGIATVGVALLASAIPALRACRVSPLAALRHE